MAPYRTYAMAFTHRRAARCPTRCTGTWPIPITMSGSIPARARRDYLIAGGERPQVRRSRRRRRALRGDRSLDPQARPRARQGGPPLVRPGARHDRLLRLHRPQSRKTSSVFVVTGDSGQGMTHGALAGLLLKDLIVSGASPWESGLRSVAQDRRPASCNYVSENVTAIKNFAEYLLPGELDSVDELQPGEGGIMQRRHEARSRPAAISTASCIAARPSARISAATCNWNSTEQCWDCPCHGSQFAPDGAVLNGPALSPLEAAKAPVERERMRPAGLELESIRGLGGAGLLASPGLLAIRAWDPWRRTRPYPCRSRQPFHDGETTRPRSLVTARFSRAIAETEVPQCQAATSPTPSPC